MSLTELLVFTVAGAVGFALIAVVWRTPRRQARQANNAGNKQRTTRSTGEKEQEVEAQRQAENQREARRQSEKEREAGQRRREERQREQVERERRAEQEREAARRREHVHGQQREQRQWWDVLEVPPNASAEEIRRSYAAKIKQYHPDRMNGLAPELVRLAEMKTKELNAAFAEAKRAR
jgi:DnaJ-domain-containing protein 1